MLEIERDEAICLYRLMKKQETELEDCLLRILAKIERVLYATMSIEEVERLAGYDE